MAQRIVPTTGQNEAVMAPGDNCSFVQRQQGKPCVVILIHGVNDLAGVYDDLETGICEGLNERLDHLTTARGGPNAAALDPATYSLPADDDSKAPNPDAVYYRRRASAGRRGNGSARSVIIPFYWGFREEEKKINKTAPHGEWLDRYGNRLDKAGTKEGGAFANATTTLPDMWGRGFSGKVAGMPANALFGSPDHPLLQAPDRRYMILAARRLAMLVTMIRRYKGGYGEGKNDTVNVVAHSQGSMITLLANALLKDQGQRPIDAFVMMNSPFSLVESGFEGMEVGRYQQTTPARIQTLANIIQFIGCEPNAVPSLADMADASRPGCIGGLRWTGGECATTIDGRELNFAERDNRGRTVLYFTPQDQTVGMQNVQGIGWQGVGDTVSCHYIAPVSPPSSTALPRTPARGDWTDASGIRPAEIRLPALSALGSTFAQRVFTIRVREDEDRQGEKVGRPPTYAYILKKGGEPGVGESTWEGTELGPGRKYVANADFSVGQQVTLNAPALPVPFVPDFTSRGGTRIRDKVSHGIAPVRQPADPVDAAIAVTNGGIRLLPVATRTLNYGYGVLNGGNSPAVKQWAEEQATDLNDLSRNPHTDPARNDWAADWHRATVSTNESGFFEVRYYESPNEAKRRMVNAPLKDQGAVSFHSAIPANPMHSRRAVAYDLAIGQAKSIDDETYYAYLCRVADWRLGWQAKQNGTRTPNDGDNQPDEAPDEDVLALYKTEVPANKDLIDATGLYHSNTVAEYDASGQVTKYGGGVLPAIIETTELPTLVVTQTMEDRRWGRAPQPGKGNPA